MSEFNASKLIELITPYLGDLEQGKGSPLIIVRAMRDILNDEFNVEGADEIYIESTFDRTTNQLRTCAAHVHRGYLGAKKVVEEEAGQEFIAGNDDLAKKLRKLIMKIESARIDEGVEAEKKISDHEKWVAQHHKSKGGAA